LRRILVLSLLGTTTVVGCGPAKTKVKGKVTYQGKPVVWGSVTLMDQQGQYFSGEIDPAGTYEIPDVPTGPVKVGVYSPNPEATDKAGAKGGKGAAGAKSGDPNDPREKFMAQQQANNPPEAAPNKPKPPPGKWFPIPDKFTDPTQSGLTGEVRKGADLDVDIK